MTTTVCLSTNTTRYLSGGGHAWEYLNYALGLRSLGCKVIWLEGLDPKSPLDKNLSDVATLRRYLERYGCAGNIALCSRSEEPLPRELTADCLDLEDATQADVFLNMRYKTRPEVIARFRRTAMIDIDPGLLQLL